MFPRGVIHAFRIFLGVLGLAAAGAGSRLQAQMPADPPELIVGTGLAGVLDSEKRELGFVELRLQQQWHGLRPWIGMDLFDEGALWVGAGVRYDLDFKDRYRLTLSFAPGYFDDGDVLPLGRSIEFFSSFELSMRVGRRGRLGASFGHISNGGLSEMNPGTEVVRVFFSIPLLSR